MSEQKRFVDRLDARPARLALRPAANRHAMAALSGSPGRGRDASRPMSRVATRAQRPPRTARRLMAVAQHPVIAKGTHASLLPPSWTTLYELTRLPEETLEAKIAEGVIHAGIERKDAEGFLEPHRDEPAAPCLRWLKFTASRPRKQATRAAQIRLHAPFLGGKMKKMACAAAVAAGPCECCTGQNRAMPTAHFPINSIAYNCRTIASAPFEIIEQFSRLSNLRGQATRAPFA
jgi:hypothetical protein